MKVQKEIYGMTRVGWVPIGTTKTIEVYVNTDDSGKVLHFHVRKYGKAHHFEWETCVKFESCDYFLHGKCKDKLPSRQVANELDAMLRQVNPTVRNSEIYWQTAVDMWNLNNSDVPLDSDLEQPDYNKLNVR